MEIKLDIMKDKTIRYIGIGVWIVIIWGILHLNYSYDISRSHSRYDLFTSHINKTICFNILHCESHYRCLLSQTFVDIFSYCFWFLCLAGGVWFSWKIRFKTASVITKIFRRIHKEV